MTYSFGWWDYSEGGQQTLINRYSGERIVYCGRLSDEYRIIAEDTHKERPSCSWTRFEYQHDEFWFPLAVSWQPQAGHILVDYNVSAEIWRRETNTSMPLPPYGGWVRVDDMFCDAVWCWPGMLENITSVHRPKEEGLTGLGGWSSGHWRNDLRFAERRCYEDDVLASFMPNSAYLHPDIDRNSHSDKTLSHLFSEFYLREKQWLRTPHPEVGQPAPSPWQFIVATPDKIRSMVHDLGGGHELRLDENVPMLPGSRIPCSIAADGTRFFQAYLPVSSYGQGYSFVFSDGEVNCLVCATDEKYNYRKTNFSFRLWEVDDRPDLCFDEDEFFTSDVGLRIARELTDIWLKWDGTHDVPGDEYARDGEYFHPRRMGEFRPLEQVLVMPGQMGGRRCRGRGRISRLGGTLKW